MKTILQKVVLICLVLAIQSWATATNPETLNFQIDSLVALQHKAGEPGGAVVVLQGEQILHRQFYGLRNVEQGLAITGQTQFDIASVAKHFTAYAILLLEKDGLLNPDTDIRHYLPELPAYPYTITIRHLLQHTSGIASSDWLRLLSGISLDEVWTHHDEISLIKQYPQLNFKPNTAYAYSNAGYSLLASIVEKVSGMSFAAYLQEKVFSPLQMQASVVLLPDTEITTDIAAGYKKTETGFEHFSSVTDYSYGAGNLLITAEDMIEWGKNLLNPSPATRELTNRLFYRYNTLENGDSIDYTYGFNVRNYRGIKMVEHSGGVPGFRNQFMIFPDHQTLIILMFNNESINTRSLALAIVQLVIGDNLTPEEGPKPRVETALPLEKIKSYEGRYRLEDGMEMGFVVEEDSFWLELPGDHRFQLFAESETRFFIKEFAAACTFVVNANGDTDRMTWHQSGRDFPAVRAEYTEPLSAEQLVQYAGNYCQPFLQANYPIHIQETNLIVELPDTFKKYLGFGKLQLSHIRQDSFLSDNLGMITFTRNEGGHVDGFLLVDVGRMKDIVFTKTKM